MVFTNVRTTNWFIDSGFYQPDLPLKPVELVRGFKLSLNPVLNSQSDQRKLLKLKEPST